METPRTPSPAERPLEIVPSVLPADFSRLGDEVVALAKAGVDRIQWDVMDGRFVPNLTFGPDVIASCRPHVTVPFEAHLMVDDPDALMHRYVEAGCELLIVHAESTRHLHRSLGRAAELGARAAVALNPATPATAVANVLDLCSMVLVMTVNPGFGGQVFIDYTEDKIRRLRGLLDSGGYRSRIQVDGGINLETLGRVVAAGAEVLVVGSAVFDSPDPGARVRELLEKSSVLGYHSRYV